MHVSKSPSPLALALAVAVVVVELLLVEIVVVGNAHSHNGQSTGHSAVPLVNNDARSGVLLVNCKLRS
jgi:hypothetical protein